MRFRPPGRLVGLLGLVLAGFAAAPAWAADPITFVNFGLSSTPGNSRPGQSGGRLDIHYNEYMSEGHVGEWERVLAASVRLQQLVPDAVLVGGSAAALHAGHRVSLDDDHVIRDLVERFDEILDALEASDGWVTARVKRPVLILGSLEGIETGIRQLIRQRPLEVQDVATASGTVRVPTLREMVRVKGWLILQRNATRDYLDFAALADRLGPDAPAAVTEMDDYYVDQRGPEGRRIATQLAKQLAEPKPYDLSTMDLRHYRGLLPRWQDWPEVLTVCRQIAVAVLAAATSPERRP
jgi:hypothetical protein